MEIVPAIDIIGGECVRLSKGDYAQKTTYSKDPLSIALNFYQNGIKRLHLVDLDGAKSKHIVNYRVLENIASKTGLIIDFGGGIKSRQDIEIAFNSGASMVTVGSIAVTAPELVEEWLDEYTPEKIILGADVKGENIAINGWIESSSNSLYPFIEKYMSKGIRRCVCTDISRDGMLTGPSVELYKKILKRFPDLFLTASGGVSCYGDLTELAEAGLPSAIVGKAFYEGKITIEQLAELANK